jgi:2-amino-4-hydroxy-6-hydroxymethyldihydropteridine diphosphokinase
MTKKIYLSLGSNLNDRERNLLLAIKKINEHGGTVIAVSSLYQTGPWGMPDQPEFLNQVIEIESDYSPRTLLQKLLVIEKEMGRKPAPRWGPRVIDIDILFFDQQIISEDDLVIPHVGIPHRRFALTPLSEIAPDYVHPLLNKTTRQLLEECTDPLQAELYIPKSS